MASKKDEAEHKLAPEAPLAAVFLGIGAAKHLARQGESRPLEAFQKAARLKKMGAPEHVIYEQTNRGLEGTPYAGISYDAAGKPRFEVSDRSAVMRGFKGRDTVSMGEFLHHPDLYKALPSAAHLDVANRADRVSGRGTFDGQTVALGKGSVQNGRATLSALGTALHEVQHHGQDVQGRPYGASPEFFRKDHPGNDYASEVRRHQMYGRVAGEVESELTRLSAAMTPEQRRAEHPTDRAKRFGLEHDRSRQIVIDRTGKVILAEMAKKPRLGDFGEKIGGARKDTAEKTGPRRPKVALKDNDPRPAWARRYVAMEQIDRLTKTGTGKWSLVDTGQDKKWGGRALIRDLPSKEAAEKAIPMAAVSSNHRVRSVIDPATKQERFEIWRDVTDRKRVKVTPESFPTREEAMRFMAQNAVKIIETKTGFGEEILVKPEKVYRTGPAVRTGDAKPNAFLKDLGARAVEFGNWQGDRQGVVNHAYDAMRDLSQVTGIAPKDLSLKGDLAIAFGARGHGLSGARAHYEPRHGAINLTKLEGAGALAHEWWHGLDHLLGRTDDPRLAELDPASPTKAFKTHLGSEIFASERVGSPYLRGALPNPVREAYRDLVESLLRKPEKYTEDVTRAEKFQVATHKELADRIADLRKYLAEERAYGQRNTKPATPEQLARFDAEAAKILSGEALKTDWRAFPVKGSRHGSVARWTNDALEAMSAVMKEVRGRSGFDSQHHRGHLDVIGRAMRTHERRVAMVADAAAQSVKTKMVPTEFAMQARKLDEGRVSDYWQRRHEMTARAFTAYVEDKLAAQGRRSDYLSFGSDNKYYQHLGMRPFPEGAERQVFNEKFDALFRAMRETNMVQPAPPPVAPVRLPGKGPAGWSDEARIASAEARGVAKPGEATIPAKNIPEPPQKPKRARARKAAPQPAAAPPARPAAPAPGAASKAAKAGNVKALAQALGTNPTRASEALRAFKTGKITAEKLDAMMPKPKSPPITAEMAAPPRKRAALSEETPHVQMAKAGNLPKAEVNWMARQVNDFAKAERGSIERRVGAEAYKDLVKVTGSEQAARSAMREAAGRKAVASAKIDASKGVLIGFQNEGTLNAALAAQGKAAPKPNISAAVISGVEKSLHRIGQVATVAAPAAAATVAFVETKRAGGSNAKAVGAAATAGAATAGVMWGAGKLIGAGFKAAAKVAPKIAPALGPAGVALGVGMMAYGAYQGAKAHGWKGAVLGTVGAEGLLDLGKQPPGPVWDAKAATPEPKAEAFETRARSFDAGPVASGGMSREAAQQFEQANATLGAMKAAKEAATGPIEVSEFTRTRHTAGGVVVTERVREHIRTRPGEAR